MVRVGQGPSLFRRQDGPDSPQRPACGSSEDLADYNTGLHVAALFIILFLSTLACSFPLIVRRFPKLPVPHRILFLSRHFGTGVLIATAFVHLLPTAFVSLTDPCLPAFWNEGYPPMAGFIAMVSVLVVVGIEMFFATRGAAHAHGEYGMLEQETAVQVNDPHSATTYANIGVRHFRQGSIGPSDSPIASKSEAVKLRRFSEVRGRSYSFPEPSSPAMYGVAGTEQDRNKSPNSPGAIDDAINRAHTRRGANQRRHGRGGSNSSSNSSNSSSPVEPSASPYRDGQGANRDLPPSERPEHPSNGNSKHEEERLLLQCLLLEAGILFHSVFIGMALSVAVGTSFIVLLVAISFHQVFEGLALGSRIAAVSIFGPSSPKPWLMALAYGTTTPIGQAIGLGVHKLYDPASQTGLLMVGIMNAISSGLLLFAGLVELLAEDFLADRSYSTLYGRKRIEACVAVVAGAMLMSVVGAFA